MLTAHYQQLTSARLTMLDKLELPKVQYTDMDEDMKSQVMEICNNACEQHASNNEMCAKMIKEILDRKFGPR